MTNTVYILGGYQSDFGRNWAREDKTLFDLMSETVLKGLEKTSLDAREIEVAHVGNFVAELFAGQGLLGGFFGHIHEDLAGIPTARHEAACASGSLAILAAMSDIMAGHYGLACVTGVELTRNVPGKSAADYLGAAIWTGKEAQDAKYIWPAMFSDLAELYDQRYGLKYEHLAAISKINFANAKRNPNAQTRGWSFEDQSFTQNDEFNPVVEGWMRRHDCGQVSDGAAVIFLASEAAAQSYADRRGLNIDDLPHIQGWGHTTAPMLMHTKMKASENSQHCLPWTRKAITDAYVRAGISGPNDLDAIETHDCFSITEYMAIEHFGLTAPGESWKAVEAGTIGFDGALPINPSGGLIGLGHPVGATGVRMMLDSYKQVTGTAGDYQVNGAARIGTYNVGGSGTANCAFIVGI